MPVPSGEVKAAKTDTCQPVKKKKNVNMLLDN